MSDRKGRATRADYRRFIPIQTRWMDNDPYGHVNNVVYYSYFDTAVNRILIAEGLLDLRAGEVIGIVVETGCVYHEGVAFPDALEAGLVVARIGRSSVRYEIGLFRDGAELAAAQGHFVHVHVERATWRPVDLPANWRAVLVGLARDGGA